MKVNNSNQQTSTSNPPLPRKNSIVRQFFDIFENQMKTSDSQFLLNLNEKDLLCENVQFYPVVHVSDNGESSVAGGFAIRFDEHGSGYLFAVVVAEEFRGKANIKTKLRAVISELFESGELRRLDLVVRQLPNGRINQKAAHIFEEIGFEIKETISVPIQGNYRDRHLFASAEPCGKSFKAVKMSLEQLQ